LIKNIIHTIAVRNFLRKTKFSDNYSVQIFHSGVTELDAKINQISMNLHLLPN